MIGVAATRFRTRLIVAVVVSAGVLLLVVANARLIYVATTSEPACVPHVQFGQGASAPGVYSAAQSACSPAQRRGDGR
jgi:hypothetical protein